MNQLIPVSLSYKRRPFDAMDGMSNLASPAPQTQSAQEEISYCENCGAKLIPNADFCDECGSKVIKPNNSCSNCGYKFERNSKFCPKCGAKRG